MEFIMEHINIIKIMMPIFLIIWALYDYIKISKFDCKNKKSIIITIKIRALVAAIISIIFIVTTAVPTHNSDSNSSNKAKIEQIETEEVQKEDDSLEEEPEQQSDETQQGQQSDETQSEQQEGEIQQEQQSGDTQQEISQDANIHKNSINGIEYKLLNQADPEWKDIKYTTRSGTIGEIGCMITTVAVVSSAYDKTMTPKKVMDVGYQHNYPSDSIPYFSSNSFTCTMSMTPDKNVIIDNLKQGNPVVIMVKAASAFTTSQHYMALIDIKSDGSEIFVGNAYGSGTGTYNRSGWFDTDTVLYDMREVHICVPSQDLINQYQ